MAWRIEQYVVKGEIHNHTPGKVTGFVWLKGLNCPIELNLKGNCYRDLAGTRLSFRNPNPIEGDYAGLILQQDGVVGDITASKKVKLLKSPDSLEDDFVHKRPIEYTIGNCLYLEWFSQSNGRVLIETADYKWRVGLPLWTLSESDERAQRELNQQAMFDFMGQLADAIEDEAFDIVDEDEMDEFQWEAYLQKNDARSDMLLELFDKYEDNPDCENLIAEAMGWRIETVEEAIDEVEDDWFDDESAEADEQEDDDYLPNHPLITQMMDIASRIYSEGESRKLFSREENNPWNQLLWHAQMTVSKLIGALEEVAEGVSPEPGFVVATLKRSLHILHLTIATLEATTAFSKASKAWAQEIRGDLFILRESILELMQTYRQKSE